MIPAGDEVSLRLTIRRREIFVLCGRPRRRLFCASSRIAEQDSPSRIVPAG